MNLLNKPRPLQGALLHGFWGLVLRSNNQVSTRFKSLKVSEINHLALHQVLYSKLFNRTIPNTAGGRSETKHDHISVFI